MILLKIFGFVWNETKKNKSIYKGIMFNSQYAYSRKKRKDCFGSHKNT